MATIQNWNMGYMSLENNTYDEKNEALCHVLEGYC